MRIFFFLSFFFFCKSVFSQQFSGVTGKVVNSTTFLPVANALVTIQNSPWLEMTNSKGEFLFKNLEAGSYYISIKMPGYKDVLMQFMVVEGQLLDLETIVLEEEFMEQLKDNTIFLSDVDLQEDTNNAEAPFSFLQATKDAFLMAAAFNWGQLRFRVRGLESQHAITMVNGMVMNKLQDGRPQWSNWGGLNDATRNQEFSIGSAISENHFGGILGTQNIITRASSFTPGFRSSFSSSNTNFRLRSMATFASGVSKKGWSYVISAGKRYANEGYFDGTSLDGTSVFLSVEKQLSDKHAINFNGFFTPITRAKNGPITEEVYKLKGAKYNAYWGFQNNEKRNARVRTVAEPIIMLHHYFKINETSNLNSSLMYQWGKITNSNFDFQNANSPDPTYYKKMPSYYSSFYTPDNGAFSGTFQPNYEFSEANRTSFLQNSQVNWAALYKSNQVAVTDVSNQIIGYAPSQSNYVLYDDRVDNTSISASSIFTSQFSEELLFTASGRVRKLQSNNYQQLTDLLGGTNFLDIDAFYNGARAQSDLNNPNRLVQVGDAYGYNYSLSALDAEFFSQFQFSFPKVDFYLAQTFSGVQYQRNGKYKNGLYENNSFGKSAVITFDTFGVKAGCTYKISGKQLLLFNVSRATKAPTIQNVFTNARLNNFVSPTISNEKITSTDATYNYRSSKLKTRLTAYYSSLNNLTTTSFFYAEGIFNDGDGSTNPNAFVSQTLSKLHLKNYGLEFSFDLQCTSTIKFSAAAAYGTSVYANNPQVSINNDAIETDSNFSPTSNFGAAFLKNYKQSGSPQKAYSCSLEYRHPKYWWLAINANYLTDNYISVAAISRTNRFFINPATGVPFPEATKERASYLLKQEKFPAVFLLNALGGKSWRIQSKYIGLFLSINNLLGLVYKSGGFEQARNANFRQLNQDVSSGTPNFGNKYFYGYGTSYFLNLTLNL